MIGKKPEPVTEKREEEYREVSPYELKDIYSPPSGAPPEIIPNVDLEFVRIFLGKDFTTTYLSDLEIKKIYYDLKIATNLFIASLDYDDINKIENLQRIMYFFNLPELAYARLKKSEHGLLLNMIGRVLRVQEAKYGTAGAGERQSRLRSLIGLR